MSADHWLTEAYFEWLKNDAFKQKKEQRDYLGLLKVLHEIPFYWTIWSDENRAGDAMSFRQYEFLGYQKNLESIDQIWLGQWATATPSVLEVMIGMARRWEYYYQGEIQFFFRHMFLNMSFDLYPGRVLSERAHEIVRRKVDDWLSRQFQPNGGGSPFPLHKQNPLYSTDMRKVEIWGQMNAYSAEHFQ